MSKVSKKKFIIISICLIAVIVACVYLYFSAAIEVDTAEISKGTIQEVVSEKGVLEAKSSITIPSQNSGEILNVHVKEGDEVKKGDLLISIKSSGEEEKANNARNEEIKGLKAQLKGLVKQQQVAGDQLTKYTLLLEQGAISYDTYTEYEVAKNKIDAEVSAMEHNIASLNALAESNNLKDEATIDGVITGVFVKEGQIIGFNEPIIEISDMKEFFIKADFIIGDANKISEGDKVIAYSDEYNYKDKTARVGKIGWKAEEKLSELGVLQKRIAVEIDLLRLPKLKLGSDIDVNVIIAEKKGVLRIPEEAIFQVEDKDAAYFVKEGKAILKIVNTGLKGEKYYEIVKSDNDIKEGDTVILSPSKELKDGSRVKKRQ